jgi:hypothetical protein
VVLDHPSLLGGLAGIEPTSLEGVGGGYWHTLQRQISGAERLLRQIRCTAHLRNTAHLRSTSPSVLAHSCASLVQVRLQTTGSYAGDLACMPRHASCPPSTPVQELTTPKATVVSKLTKTDCSTQLGTLPPHKTGRGNSPRDYARRAAVWAVHVALFGLCCGSEIMLGGAGPDAAPGSNCKR